MEAKFSVVFTMYFIILFLVDQGSADELDSLFGRKTLTKDAMLYTAIIIFIISVFALIFVIALLSMAYRVAKRRNSRNRSDYEEDHRDSYDNREVMMMHEKERSTVEEERPRQKPANKPKKYRDDSSEDDRRDRKKKSRKDESSDEEQQKPRKKKNGSDEEYDKRRKNTREKTRRKSLSDDDERYEKPRELPKKRSSQPSNRGRRFSSKFPGEK